MELVLKLMVESRIAAIYMFEDLQHCSYVLVLVPRHDGDAETAHGGRCDAEMLQGETTVDNHHPPLSTTLAAALAATAGHSAAANM